MRKITNGQLSLEDLARRLCSKVQSILKDVAVDEDSSLRSYPRLAQAYSFRSLHYKVSNFAIELIEREWSQLNRLVNAGVDLGDCHCEILLRYGIACKHHLLRAHQNWRPNTSIPHSSTLVAQRSGYLQYKLGASLPKRGARQEG